MSAETTEIPVVESEQVAEISSASHSQSVLIKYDDQGVYMVMWDGKALRLMQPAGVDIEQAVVAYKILGHLEVSLPFPLDPVTMERQAQILINSYHDGSVEEAETSLDEE